MYNFVKFDKLYAGVAWPYEELLNDHFLFNFSFGLMLKHCSLATVLRIFLSESDWFLSILLVPLLKKVRILVHEIFWSIWKLLHSGNYCFFLLSKCDRDNTDSQLLLTHYHFSVTLIHICGNEFFSVQMYKLDA